jgi:hypothetical protein
MCLGKTQNKWQKSPLLNIFDGPRFHLGNTGNDDSLTLDRTFNM